MRTILKTTLCLAPLLLALPGHAAEREWIPYRKLVSELKMDKVYALPATERDKIIVFAKLVPVNKSIAPPSAGLVVVDGASRTPLALDPIGRVRVVPNAQWLADDAQIWTNLPKGEKISLGFDLGAVLPETAPWRYASVMGAIPQSNAAIGKVAGAFSLFMPKMKTVIFKFDKPAQMTIKSAGGDKRYASDAKHQVRLKFDEDLLKENPAVEWSERPLEAEIDE